MLHLLIYILPKVTVFGVQPDLKQKSNFLHRQAHPLVVHKDAISKNALLGLLKRLNLFNHAKCLVIQAPNPGIVSISLRFGCIMSSFQPFVPKHIRPSIYSTVPNIKAPAPAV